MIFGSLFSGIEAASAAWLPLGWTCAWTAEIDPFASAVLRRHYPDTPNLGDVNRIDPDAIEPVDLVVFGSPCQSFSTAGKRLGLDDPRGNMALVGLRLIGRIRPRWVVWENVPGILSSDGGRDFGAFLGLMGQLGYGFAYRVLDAQHAGVPQRRRRVFVVGYLGDWRPPAAVLFEQQSLRRNPAPRREAGERIAPTIESGANRTGGPRPPGTTVDTADSLVAFTAKSRCASDGGIDREDRHTLIARCVATGSSAGTVTEDGTGRGTPLVAVTISNGSHTLGDVSGTLDAAARGSCQQMPLTLAIRGRGDSHDLEWRDDGTANAVLTPNGGRAGIGVGAVMFDPTSRQPEWSLDRPMKTDGPPAVQTGMAVRRLTPGECLKLQGFPPDYLDIQYRGKPAADGNKYRATGNSMAVPVIRWIGQRIQLVTDTSHKTS